MAIFPVLFLSIVFGATVSRIRAHKRLWLSYGQSPVSHVPDVALRRNATVAKPHHDVEQQSRSCVPGLMVNPRLHAFRRIMQLLEHITAPVLSTLLRRAGSFQQRAFEHDHAGGINANGEQITWHD
ncbi:hypothetical protein E2C01_068546 [Portunus trituberculatus]|uniref:Secreted protein n=1 Tax=Portunus trituberculatus TaxID=210409 RepID=A0A5B7HWE5_PORTR|nr:hypothetical protein [Portunus trituberculatus]